MFSMLSKMSADETLKYYSYFSQKIGFVISYNLFPNGQFAWDVKAYILRKLSSVYRLLNKPREVFEFCINP